MAYTTTPADNEVIANLPGDIRAVTASLTSHTGATSEAHIASAISYGTENVKAALDKAAEHQENPNNPHGVTAAQAGAVALADAVTTVTAGKIVKRDDNGRVAGDITGSSTSCTGNATTATKLSTARTISLTGDVSGSVSFDGSANAAITAVVEDDSHTHTIATLPTYPTPGNFVAILTGTIVHGGTIPLPAGYTQGQCKWMVSPYEHKTSYAKFRCYANSNRVVTSQSYAGYSDNSSSEIWSMMTANYIIIGVK